MLQKDEASNKVQFGKENKKLWNAKFEKNKNYIEMTIFRKWPVT